MMIKSIVTILVGVAVAAQLFADNAILVKEGTPVVYDKLTEQGPVDRYGEKDNLDGPGIENKYFVFFLPLITGTFNSDLIGKRQDVQVLDLFKKTTRRHGGAEWGEDIISTKKACGAGFPLIRVGEEMVMPGFGNSESVEVKIHSAEAHDTAFSIFFTGLHLGNQQVDIEWHISTHWEARWIRHQFNLPNDFPYPIQFGITRHLEEYTLNMKQCYIYGLGDQTYDNIAEKRVLMGVKAAKANFVDFFTSEENVGIETKPDEANTITLWTTYSWEAEPSPIFDDAGVTGVLFEGAQ